MGDFTGYKYQNRSNLTRTICTDLNKCNLNMQCNSTTTETLIKDKYQVYDYEDPEKYLE